MSYQRLPTENEGDEQHYGDTRLDVAPQATVDSGVELTSSSIREVHMEEGVPPPTQNGEYVVNIVSLGRPNKTMVTSPSTTILQLKQQAFPDEMQERKNVRIIFQGKLLTDDKSLQECGVPSDGFIHCAISEFRAQDEAPEPAPQQEGDEIPAWLLREAQLRQLYAEEPQQGTNADFLLGFLMGLILGLFALCWVWARMVPRKQKAGILMGISFRLFLTFWSQEQSSTGNNN